MMDTGDKRIIIVNESFPTFGFPYHYRFFIYDNDGIWFLRTL